MWTEKHHIWFLPYWAKENFPLVIALLTELGHSYYFLNNGCVSLKRLRPGAAWNPSCFPNMWCAMIPSSLIEHIRGRHVGTSVVVWRQRCVCCRLWFDKLWNISQLFGDITLFSMHNGSTFDAPKMWYMGKITWKVAHASMILVLVHLCDLHVQVRTWVHSGEQLPLILHCWATNLYVIWGCLGIQAAKAEVIQNSG